MHLNRRWPVVMTTAGVGIFVFGQVYDLTFSGFPYQDPTPEIAANYARHSRIAEIFYLVGIATVAAGTIASIVRVVVRRSRGVTLRSGEGPP